MTKREAKREACRHAAELVGRDANQGMSDHDSFDLWSVEDQRRFIAALQDIQDELWSRGVSSGK